MKHQIEQAEPLHKRRPTTRYQADVRKGLTSEQVSDLPRLLRKL